MFGTRAQSRVYYKPANFLFFDFGKRGVELKRRSWREEMIKGKVEVEG